MCVIMAQTKHESGLAGKDKLLMWKPLFHISKGLPRKPVKGFVLASLSTKISVLIETRIVKVIYFEPWSLDIFYFPQIIFSQPFSDSK